MESEAAKRARREAERERVRRQVVALQAKLAALDDDGEGETAPATPLTPSSPKRKRTDSAILAPASPSPKRRRITPKDDISASTTVKPVHTSTPLPHSAKARQSVTSSSHSASLPLKPQPSKLLSQLPKTKSERVKKAETYENNRTDAFSSRPGPPKPAAEADSLQIPMRDDRLAIIADLKPGPYEHRVLQDDPNFQKLEPHSGIHLSRRELPHEDLMEYLTGRYYISPSTLYSVIRLLPNNEGYDVPVVGDWVTIAVVAERGPVRVSRGPTMATSAEGDAADDNEAGGSGAGSASKQQLNMQYDKKKKKAQEPPKPTGRKYVNLRLVDFGARSRGSDLGGKAVIRGDAFLSLLLFESDSKEKIPREGGGLPEIIYKGGSKGAFERMSTMPEGAVVALLNPRILKPFTKTTDKPHPTTNVLALTPESIKSVAVIGHARDLGRCDVRKKDGHVCGSWYDKRVSGACEFHVQSAVERRRNTRPEFSASTSTLGRTAVNKKADFDPKRKWGLQPEAGPSKISTDSGGATYVVSGHVVNDKRHLFLGESMGREAQAKARRAGKKNEDRQLKSLLERDREGMQHVELAREHAEKLRKARKGDTESVSGKAKANAEANPVSATSASAAQDTAPVKATYSAEVIKNLGFDPTIKPGQKMSQDGSSFHTQLNRLASERASKPIALGPRPGTKHRTSIRPPPRATEPLAQDTDESDLLVNLDSSDIEPGNED